jgi:hypothetical protein
MPTKTKPRTAYIKSAKPETATMPSSYSLEDVQSLCLYIYGQGDVQLSKASLVVLHRVFEALMITCECHAPSLHKKLMDDDKLHLSKMQDWKVILNKLLAAGVVLPVVKK